MRPSSENLRDCVRAVLEAGRPMIYVAGLMGLLQASEGGASAIAPWPADVRLLPLDGVLETGLGIDMSAAVVRELLLARPRDVMILCDARSEIERGIAELISQKRMTVVSLCRGVSGKGPESQFSFDISSRKELLETLNILMRGFLESQAPGRDQKMLAERLRGIQLIVWDFDGVFTDNKVIVSESGEESAVCNRSDGVGLSRIFRLGIDSLILSTEENPIVRYRAEKLGLKVIHGVRDKTATLSEVLSASSLSRENVCFVGNDLNDMDVMKFVGLSIAPADAFGEIRRVADFVLSSPGGQYAVREICDLLYELRR